MKVATKPLLVFAGIVVLIAAGFLVFKNFKVTPQNASLLVGTPYAKVEVFLDDQPLGQTPLQKDDLSTGEYNLKLISGEQIYQTKINLLGGTQTAVHREFVPADTFSAGNILWFEKTGRPAAVSITSEPDAVRVKIDGRDVGETPVLVEDIEAGTHDLHLSLENFETRQINIRVKDGYQLRISSKLALVPLPATELKEISFSGEETTVYNLSPTATTLFVDTASLAKGIIYWARTRGLGTTQTKLDYFVDSQGTIYDSEGQTFDPEVFDGEQIEAVVVGYLGNAGDEDLGDQAKSSLVALTKKVLKTPPVIDKVKILPTGTGWLRVRTEPSLSGSEMAKVNVGESFALLEEKTGWVKIKLPDGRVGWVSSDFVEKFQEAP